MDQKKYKKPRVLVIEDSPTLLFFYNTLFQKYDQGILFDVARSGDKALDLLRKQPFDLLITDLIHCGGSGIPFLETINKTWPELPVIVCSGYSSAAKVEETFRAGVKDYIIKPFHPSLLIQTIRKVLFEEKVGSNYIRQCLTMVCHHISYLLAPGCKSEWGFIGLKKPDLITIEDCSEAVTRAYEISPSPYLSDVPEASGNFPLDRFAPPTLECIQNKHVITLNFPSIRITEKKPGQVLDLSTLLCIPIFPQLSKIQCIHLFPHAHDFPVPASWSVILQAAEKHLASSLQPIREIIEMS